MNPSFPGEGTLALVMGDQLFSHHPGIPRTVPILMCESYELCTRWRHHKQKLVLFLAAMRHHREELIKQDYTVYYNKVEESNQSFIELVAQTCNRLNTATLIIYNPADTFILEQIRVQLPHLRLVILPNPMFLTSREHWIDFRKSRKRLLMADFYQTQRQRLNILVHPDGSPIGGKWSFDDENRKSIPKHKIPPAIPRPLRDSIVQNVIELVEKLFPNHPGQSDTFDWPVTRQQARVELEAFIQSRLHDFGPYEDAISQFHPHLYHSLLSPLLNLGFLTPNEVITGVAKAQAPIQSKEGMIRQIIGWREFIYHISLDYQETQQQFHAFNGNRTMKPCWMNGTTGLPPIDHAVKKVIRSGYCHHIERLMILGSPMLMVGINPNQVYKWFMEHFIDSADWVMAPNVFGMSQFADGGTFATKPYISGSAYIRKMSDFPAGDWCDVWDGLYWQFISLHRVRLSQNHRMGMMINQLDKMESGRKEKIFTAAQKFVERTTN